MVSLLGAVLIIACSFTGTLLAILTAAVALQPYFKPLFDLLMPAGPSPTGSISNDSSSSEDTASDNRFDLGVNTHEHDDDPRDP